MPAKITSAVVCDICFTAGNGPKRLLVEEVREKLELQSRVTLLGEVDHSEVCSVSEHSHSSSHSTNNPLITEIVYTH